MAIVTRNGGEFVTVLQEEVRRLGVLERLGIEPGLLLLTPVGRFALALYDLNAAGRLEHTPGQFEMMIASGWLLLKSHASAVREFGYGSGRTNSGTIQTSWNGPSA